MPWRLSFTSPAFRRFERCLDTVDCGRPRDAMISQTHSSFPSVKRPIIRSLVSSPNALNICALFFIKNKISGYADISTKKLFLFRADFSRQTQSFILTKIELTAYKYLPVPTDSEKILLAKDNNQLINLE